MTREHLVAISTACGALIGFQGVMHETVGAIVFPFGPAALGGPIGWHALGIFGMALGSWMMWSALSVERRGLIAGAWLAEGLGVFILIFTAVRFERFHIFALTIMVAAGVLIACQRALRALDS